MAIIGCLFHLKVPGTHALFLTKSFPLLLSTSPPLHTVSSPHPISTSPHHSTSPHPTHLSSTLSHPPHPTPQFTTLENTPPEFLICGSAARQAFSADTFPLGLATLHLLTGQEPYEELLADVRCPAYLKQIWAG